MNALRTMGLGSVWLAASFATLPLVTPAGADEIFVCDDRSTVLVNSRNRAAMAEHPCVKAWFDRNKDIVAPVRKSVVGTAQVTEVPQMANAAPSETPPAASAEPKEGEEVPPADSTTARPDDADAKASVTKGGRRTRAF